MSNIENYFGIKVSVREQVDAESLLSYQEILERLMQFVDFNLDNYFVYVHFITITTVFRKKFFGNAFSLNERIDALTLIYKVNKKQRQNMKFYNEYGSFKYAEGTHQIPEESQVQFIFDSTLISESVLETKLITFLKKENIRKDHMKIKLEVRPHPTTQFENALRKEKGAELTPREKRREKSKRKNKENKVEKDNDYKKSDSFTAMDLHFSKNLKFTIPQLLVAIDNNPKFKYPESVETFINSNSSAINDIMLNNWNISKKKMAGDYEVKLIKIKKWLENFLPSEYAYALRVMEKIAFYSNSQVEEWVAILAETIRSIYKEGLTDVYFFGIGNSPSDSGSKFLYSFRQKLKLSDFNFPKEIEKVKPLNPKALIFVDDIIGTGKQASRYFQKNLKDLNIDCYYCALVGFKNGIDYIKENSGFKKVFVAKILSDSDQAFSPNSTIFPAENEKIKIKEIAQKYGNELYPIGPLGFNNCQAMVVFEHNVPNNTLPIIWAGPENEKEITKPWNPLFGRIKY